MKNITGGEWKRDGEAIQVSWDQIQYGEIRIGDEVEFDGVTCKVTDTGNRFKNGGYAYGYLYVTKLVGEASQVAAPKGERRVSDYDATMNQRHYDMLRENAMDRGEQWPTIQVEGDGSAL